MKKVTLVIISILFILSVSACKAEEERQYTYIASDPDFGTQETVKKDFGDFTITFPSSWEDQTAVFSEELDGTTDDGVEMEVCYVGMYPSKIDLYSNVAVMKMDVGVDMDMDDFDEAFAQLVADEIAGGLDIEVSTDQILYGLLGNKEAAVMYFSYDYFGISCQTTVQLIPFDNGSYYYLNYTLFSDEGQDDIEAIMNSVKFK